MFTCKEKLLHIIDYFLSYSVTRVSIDGNEYAKSSVVLCGFEYGLPVFGEVKHLLITALQEVIFVMDTMSSDYFDRHYHSYHVVPERDHLIIVKSHQLLDHQVLHANKTNTLDDNLFVCVKYHVFP